MVANKVADGGGELPNVPDPDPGVETRRHEFVPEDGRWSDPRWSVMWLR